MECWIWHSTRKARPMECLMCRWNWRGWEKCLTHSTQLNASDLPRVAFWLDGFWRVSCNRRQDAFTAEEGERSWTLECGGTRVGFSLDARFLIFFNNCTLIISLKNNFKKINKYIKIHDFFSSINRDLVYFIWTQKKIPSFSLSSSYYIFLLAN
jgi:hypothetical protein